MMSKKKMTTLSLKQKLQLIREVEEEKEDKQILCQKYRCDISTVYRIMRKKHDILRSSVEKTNLNRRRNRKGVHDNVEQALATWYDQKQQANSIVNCSMLINKAKELAMKFGEDFEPDSSWLFRWRKRQNIKLAEVKGQTNDQNNKQSDANYVNTILPDILKEYNPENIMNADEGGLFYKESPTETCYLPDISSTGDKIPKDRFTLLFICNSTGTFKRVYVIGKSSSLLQHINPPIPYITNSMAWMTTGLWSDIILSLDVEMQNENRKIVLFIDQASCHKTPHLKNIEIQYLPLKTASIQPLQQGIIHNFKTNYREIIVKKHLTALERDVSVAEFYKSISLLDALHFIKRAWELVLPETIEICFRGAGFSKILEGVDVYQFFPNSKEYMKCDDNSECHGELLETENSVFIKEELMISDEETEAEDEESNRTPSLKEALDALNTLQKYCMHNYIDTTVLDQIEDQILTLRMKSLEQAS